MQKPPSLLLAIMCLVLFPVLLYAQDFDELNEQADKEYSANNYQKAIDLATRSINLKINPRSYFIRADCRFSLKDYEAALDDYNTAISNYSSYYNTDKYKGRLYYWRGRSKQKLKKYNDAISDFNNSLTNNYEDTGYAYWNRGNCYYELEMYKESDDDYAKAIDRLSASKDLANLYKYRGDCNAKLENYDNAEKFYTRAISYDADYYSAYWSRGYYRHLNLKNDDAIADYIKATSIIEASGTNDHNTDLAAIYRNMTLLDIDLEKYTEALKHINKSLLADPNYVDAFKTRAEIYQHLKMYDKAKADYTNAISLVNDDKTISDLYFERSYKLDWEILDYKTALDDLNKSIALDSKSSMKFWHRAITYDYKKDYPKALAECAKAIQLYGEKGTSGLYTLRASLKEKTGDIKGAISDYQAAIKLDNNSASIYYNLGRLFKTKLKNDDLAQINLTKAFEMSKEESTSATYAYAKVVNGESEEGISLILKNIEKNKDDNYQNKWQLHNAACIYALAGNKVKALEYLDKSLAAGFDDYNHLVNDRDLLSISILPQYKAMLTKYKVPQPKW